jgi:hypothetical protein
MAGADPCEEFLRVISKDNDGLTTRVADAIIHYHKGYHSMTPEEQLEHHKAKQQEILDSFQGCEAQIFNDPTVEYPYREHFRGKTGTMSNILTSGYFTVYDTLQRMGIEVNALHDYITLFFLASSLTVKDGAFVMESAEFEAMKRILVRLKSMLPDTELFTETWFTEYKQFLRAAHFLAKQKYSYYKENSSHQTLNQALEWVSGRLPPEEQKELAAKYFFGSESHQLYEYYPPYMNPDFNTQLIETYLANLSTLETLFTNPDEAEQVDFLPKKPNSAKKTTKKLRRGGSRTRKLKRKGNRPFALRGRPKSPR